jgi:thiol:disulfide interchange protein
VRGGNTAASLGAAVARAKREGKPLVALCFATWCPACQALEHDVLPDAAVKAALAEVTFVRFDLDTRAGGAAGEKLGCDYIPKLVHVDADGAVVARSEDNEVDDVVAFVGAATQRTR